MLLIALFGNVGETLDVVVGLCVIVMLAAVTSLSLFIGLK